MNLYANKKEVFSDTNQVAGANSSMSEQSEKQQIRKDYLKHKNECAIQVNHDGETLKGRALKDCILEKSNLKKLNAQ